MLPEVPLLWPKISTLAAAGSAAALWMSAAVAAVLAGAPPERLAGINAPAGASTLASLPKEKDTLPPGGARTRLEGRSVRKLPQFCPSGRL